MKKNLVHLLSWMLVLAMVVGLFPVMSFATQGDETAVAQEATKSEKSPYSLTIASSTMANLAPGVTETTVVSYDSNGDRVQYFVVNANIATDSTVQVKANYQNNDNTGNWGKATVVEQANAAKEKRGYNVVASTNASYYNVSTGQPTGGFVMEGVNINGNGAGDSYPFFAVLKDGTAMIGQKGTFSQYADQIQEAVGGWTMLVWDGKLVATGTSKYPRSTVGVKANGDVVLMLADGNQKPYSAGLTLQEQGQLMLELGCIAAVELDGGGSATYAAKLEGTDEIVVRNSCCDGTVRSVSNTLMVISTAVADGTFDHANLSTEYAFYAANSTIAIEAVGADIAGGPAELPELTWELADSSFGTVENGVFVSNGKTGVVTVKALAEGEVVGTIDVSVVHPTEISFSAEEKTVPYGKTSDFTITAMYNGAETYVHPDAFEFNLEAGSIDGFVYTAPGEESGITTATVTATYKYAVIPAAEVTVTYGKGSEILIDFESGDASEWAEYYGMVKAAEEGRYTNGYTVIYEEAGATSGNLVEYGIRENVFLASRENGDPVYSGDYALGYTLDYTQSSAHANWQYAYLYYLGDVLTYRDVEKGINGTRLGMWMYIPEEAVGLCARMAYTYKDANGALNTAYLYFTYQYVKKGFSKLTSAIIPEAGWAYVYCDLDDISTSYVTSAYYKTEDGTLTREEKSNYAPAFIQFIVSSSATGAEKCTVYIDDITLDYSDVVDDRDAPLIKNPVALDDQNTYAMGSTINFNTVSFTADAVEDTSHGTNYTGLNVETAQIYIDGHKVPTTFAAGKIATNSVVLPNGIHDVTFEIADKQGNYTKVTKQITVAAETDYPVITVTGSAPCIKADGKLYTGSQYNIMVNTDKVEAIDKVTTKIWLNSASKWALEHMTALEGFEAEYVLDERACTAEITITRVGNVDLTGEATLVTIPVYAWAWDGSAGWDSNYQWNTEGCAPVVTVSYKVKYGEVIYTDAFAVEDGKYIPGFGNIRQDVKTELDTSIANLKKTIGIWHSHTVEAVADRAATCVEDGFEGRTVCTVCKSILNWGTMIPAAGHSYTLIDGLMKCSCGDLLNGEYEGKYYVDGAIVPDGWLDDSYFLDGVKQTGIILIDGLYYDLGEDGISRGTYTGLFEMNGQLYNAALGKITNGWQTVDGAWYYFDPTTNAAYRNGTYTIDTYKSTFDENGVLVAGEFVRVFHEGKLVTRYMFAGKAISWQFFDIDGERYYFYRDASMATGISMIQEHRYGTYSFYEFDENGVCKGLIDETGVYAFDGKLYAVINGEVTPRGMFEWNGGLYYANWKGVVQTGKYYLDLVNDYISAPGYYYFDENGKMFHEEVGEIDGTLYYFVNGQPVNPGKSEVIDVNGNYYMVNWNGRVSSGKVWVSNTNDVIAEAGYYYFDETGRMYDNEFATIDGAVYYMVGGRPLNTGKSQVMDINGEPYYIGWNGKISTGKVWVTNTGKYVDAAGYYFFDENGKMIMRGLADDEGTTYFIVDGRTYQPGKSQFVELENGMYYVAWNGRVSTGKVWVSNTAEYGWDTGYYYFDVDGRMFHDEFAIIDGQTYYMYIGRPAKSDKSEVIAVGDELYYVLWDGKVSVGGEVWINNTNEYIAERGYYYLDETGRVYNEEIVNLDGSVYYMVMGQIGATGSAYVAEADGVFYFVNWNGKVSTGKVWVSNPNEIAPEKGYYYFDETGKMYDKVFVELDGAMYYMVAGQPVSGGVFELDGNLYYADWQGVLAVSEKVYITESSSNGLIRFGWHTFNENGVMIG